MTESEWEEAISLAYVRAVAAAARCQVVRPELDDACWDTLLTRNDSVAELRIQLKATRQPRLGTAGVIKYQVDRRLFDFATRDTPWRHLLVVVALPEAGPQAAVEWTLERVSVARCAWWIELKTAGLAFPADQGSMTIDIPLQNVFNPAHVEALLTAEGPLAALYGRGGAA